MSTTKPIPTYTADDTISVVVKVQDAFGNTVIDGSGSGATVGLALSGGNTTTLGGTASKAATAGVASFTDLTVHTVGSGYKLIASAGPLARPTSYAFDITHGTESKLA